VLPRVDRAASDRVAIGEQHWVAPLVGGYRRRVACHYIGAIDEISDPTKTLRLALRAEVAARDIKTQERRIALRRDARFDIEGEGVRHIGKDQSTFRRKLISVGAQRLTVERQRDKFERFPIEMQRGSVFCGGRVAANREARFDPCVLRAEFEDEVDGVDQIGRRLVIG
jgi:hypothetical protein